MSSRIQALRGMEDILPEASALWERLEEECRAVFRQYGYRNMRTPIVEPTALFVRGIGEVTDIVEKEMYSFSMPARASTTEDRTGESLSLRPEATAGIVRAAIEHNLLYNGPMRVWTAGPMFRYERPQKGRQRQFHQFDAEALGFEGPDVDAEQIVMLARLWKSLGLPLARAEPGSGSDGLELHINSIADSADRKAHRDKLVAYFEKHAAALDEDARRRLHANPLRILDSKNPAMQELIENAPRLIDHLGDGAMRHFEELQRLLRGAGLPFRVNPRIVRGLDYYNRTVFEWISPRIGAQSTIAGGGRYDALFEQLGGKPTPACGFAFGIERLVLAMQAAGAAARYEPDVFLVHAGEAAQASAWRVSEALRDARLEVVLGPGGSLKSQMRRADASGARYAVIIGEDEARSNTLTVKPLRGGEQRSLELAPAIAFISRVNT